MWEKDKMLFSPNYVLYPFSKQIFLPHLSCLQLMLTISNSQTCCLVKSFAKGQNFRLVQIESTCRQHTKCESKIKIWFGKGRKKEDNAGYQHFLLFHNVFKRPLLQVHKKSELCGRGVDGLNYIIEDPGLQSHLKDLAILDGHLWQSNPGAHVV